MDINVTPLTLPSVPSLPVEIVERKGMGHPDSICDALAEQLSMGLSRFYLDRFGFILHHNVDKVLLRAGAARAVLGGGEVLQPIELFLAGRAVEAFQGVKVPIERLAAEVVRSWLRDHIRHLDCDRDVRVHCLIRPGSADLVELYLRQRKTGVPLANDTSCGVGYAPLDRLERLVLQVERHLNSPAVKAACPEIGEDIKVMGVRRGERIHLTVACAMVARYVRSMTEYGTKKARLRELVLEVGQQVANAAIEVELNTGDGDTPDSIYLTVTGTSAEAGDDGQVGRGNRVNGLITPYRPMSLEAIAGKNPVTHVGKLYNVVANRIARATIDEFAEISEAYCFLVGQIGRPIDHPYTADLKVRTRDDAALPGMESRLRTLVQDHLASLRGLWRELIFKGQDVS